MMHLKRLYLISSQRTLSAFSTTTASNIGVLPALRSITITGLPVHVGIKCSEVMRLRNWSAILSGDGNTPYDYIQSRVINITITWYKACNPSGWGSVRQTTKVTQ